MKPKNLLQNAALILLQCFLSIVLFAQTPPPKQWDKRFGGTEFDNLYSIQQTKDGGYILGGYSASGIGGDKTEDSRGGEDYWVVKTDATGKKQWDKRFGGTVDDALSFIQQTPDGGYILGGDSYSGIGGDKTEDSRGESDYWIVKTDATGSKQWDKRFGGTDYEYFGSVQQTKDGGYILGGGSKSGIGGDKTEDGRGGIDYWIVKTDADGNKQWDKRFGGTDYDYLVSIRQTTDGGYILGGYSYSGIGGDKTENRRGWYDYWIVKTDADGNKQWDKRFGGTDYDKLSSIQPTRDGGYILGGLSYSDDGGDKTEDSRGHNDYWIVKTDADGNKQWDKRFGGTGSDYPESIQQTTDGGYILGGASTSGIGGDKTEGNYGYGDYWIVKADATGNKQWDKRFGGTDGDVLHSIQQTTDGGYILGGSSSSGIDGDKTENSRGSSDYWIVKLGCPPASVITASGSLDLCQTGSVQLSVASTDNLNYRWLKNNRIMPAAKYNTYTATEAGTYRVIVYAGIRCTALSNPLTVINSCEDIAENDISISPNPSNGLVTVTYKSITSAQIVLSVYDKTGRLMFTKTAQALAGNNVYKLNLSNLLPGTYNLQLNNNSENMNAKFVVQK